MQRGYLRSILTKDYFSVSARFLAHTKQAGHITRKQPRQLWTWEKMKQSRAEDSSVRDGGQVNAEQISAVAGQLAGTEAQRLR